MLRLSGKGMLKVVQGCSNIVGHGDVPCALDVIPFALEAKVFCATPVGVHGVGVS